MTYGAVRILGLASSVLVLIGVALFFALGAAPAVSWLVQRRLPRWAAVMIVAVVVFGVLAASLAAAVPPLMDEAHQFIEDAPSLAVHSGSDQTATQAAVIFDDVGKVFANARGVSTAALANVTLNVARGEVFGIIGRSGAGKSTLLRLVNGLEA